MVSNVYIKKNEINLHDSLFGVFNDEDDDYFYEKGDNVYFTADVDEGPGPGVLFY